MSLFGDMLSCAQTAWWKCLVRACVCVHVASVGKYDSFSLGTVIIQLLSATHHFPATCHETESRPVRLSLCNRAEPGLGEGFAQPAGFTQRTEENKAPLWVLPSGKAPSGRS